MDQLYLARLRSLRAVDEMLDALGGLPYIPHAVRYRMPYNMLYCFRRLWSAADQLNTQLETYRMSPLCGACNEPHGVRRTAVRVGPVWSWQGDSHGSCRVLAS